MTLERKEFYYDKRVTEYYQRKGIITKKDVEAHLKNLPNDEDNFELAPFEDDDLELDSASLEDVSDLDVSDEDSEEDEPAYGS